MRPIPTRELLKAVGMASLLTTMACNGCGASAKDPAPAPTARQQPAPAATVAPSAEKPAPAAPAAAPKGWVRVRNDSAPFFEEPETDDIDGYLAQGQLLERRVETRPEFINVTALTIHAQGPEGRTVDRSGPITTIKQSEEDTGWTFAEDLGPAPDGLPSRDALCDALAAPPKPVMERELCESEAKVILFDSAKASERLAVIWARLPDKKSSRLATVDLDAVAAHKPAIRDTRDTGFLLRVLQASLPDGGAWIIAQELFRKESVDGWNLDFLAMDAGGKLAPAQALPLETKDVKRPLITNYTVNARVDRAESGPTVTLEGNEVTQQIESGDIKSKRNVKQVVTWDAAKKKLVVR